MASLLELPEEMIIALPSWASWLLTYALTPWVKVSAAITAATPIKIPSAVKNERPRFAHNASNALPRLAPNSLPLLRRCTRNSVSTFLREDVCTALVGATSISVRKDAGRCICGGLFLTESPPLPPPRARSSTSPTPPQLSAERTPARRAQSHHRGTPPVASRTVQHWRRASQEQWSGPAHSEPAICP